MAYKINMIIGPKYGKRAGEFHSVPFMGNYKQAQDTAADYRKAGHVSVEIVRD